MPPSCPSWPVAKPLASWLPPHQPLQQDQLLSALAGLPGGGKGQGGGWEQERKGRKKCWAKQLWPSLLPAAPNLSLQSSAQTPAGGDMGGCPFRSISKGEEGTAHQSCKIQLVELINNKQI